MRVTAFQYGSMWVGVLLDVDGETVLASSSARSSRQQALEAAQRLIEGKEKPVAVRKRPVIVYQDDDHVVEIPKPSEILSERVVG